MIRPEMGDSSCWGGPSQHLAPSACWSHLSWPIGFASPVLRSLCFDWFPNSALFFEGSDDEPVDKSSTGRATARQQADDLVDDFVAAMEESLDATADTVLAESKDLAKAKKVGAIFAQVQDCLDPDQTRPRSVSAWWKSHERLRKYDYRTVLTYTHVFRFTSEDTSGCEYRSIRQVMRERARVVKPRPRFTPTKKSAKVSPVSAGQSFGAQTMNRTKRCTGGELKKFGVSLLQDDPARSPLLSCDKCRTPWSPTLRPSGMLPAR
jgi:hypothetical protein